MVKYLKKGFDWVRKNPGTTFNFGFGTWSAFDTYQEAREAGDSKFVSMGQAAVDFAMATMMGFVPYMAFQAVTSAPSAAVNLVHELDMRGRQLQVQNSNRAFQNSTFSDSEQAHTMRQAGMAIAQRSRYNTQQAMLGNEAKYMMK